MSDGCPYVELDVISNFSFLEGASHPEELIACAAALGFTSIGLADRMTMAGMVRAHTAALKHGIDLCVGARLNLRLDTHSEYSHGKASHSLRQLESIEIIAYATDRSSYGRLCRAITLGRTHEEPLSEDAQTFERTCWDLTIHQFIELSEGFEMIVLQPSGSEFMSHRLVEVLSGLRRHAPGRVSLAVSRLGEPEECLRIRQCRWLAHECAVPLVATNGVRFHDPTRRKLHDVLSAIKFATTVAAAGFALLPNNERHLRTPSCMHARWRDLPHAVERSKEIAERCRGFSLSQLQYQYPREVVPDGTTAMSHLRNLTRQGAQERYPSGAEQKVCAQMERELDLIEELDYASYFLTVHDIVRFARSRGILCQGRGAAANSVVCFCLGVTAVDPVKINLLFERFVSRERQEPPDIDIDFEHERREEVIQYIYARYGRMRAAICAAVVCYRRRLALRETAKALGFTVDAIDQLVRGLSESPSDEEVRTVGSQCGIEFGNSALQELLQLAGQIEGFPRHLSQHSGGFVITEAPLCDMVPIRNASMDGRTMIEWDKDDIDAMGMLKIDILALGMLTCIRKTLAMIGRPVEAATKGSTVCEIALHTIPPEDPATYEMMTHADTIGVFQIESRAQMAMLPRLRPKCFYDLVIEVALVRPGPIQGDMVHPYLRRRSGEEAPSYPSEAVRQILERTLGIPIFQEQAMALAITAAGFTAGEADQLRRSIAAWKRSKNMLLQFKARLENGMIARGYRLDFARQVFQQIQGFSGYGFPESHAASFAHLVYASAWLKRHHPAAFAAALLNSQPMGFYAPAQIVQDAKRHGVIVLPIDVNISGWECSLESLPPGRRSESLDTCAWGSGGPALRLGMRMVRGLCEADGIKVMRQTGAQGHSSSVEELWRSSGMSVSAIRRLARADAFGSMGLDRQSAIWQSQKLRTEDAPLFTISQEPDHTTRLPAMNQQLEVALDYAQNGLSLKAHPISFARERLARRGIVSCADIGNETRYSHAERAAIAGFVMLRQRPPTAKGVVFITLEDETGSANVIIRPHIWKRDRAIGRHASHLIAHGTVQYRDGTIHLIATRLEGWPAHENEKQDL